MPVWHEKTKESRDAGVVEVVGLIQEQHPDRCRLFMQWHQMEWPVLSDPLNQLGVAVVPIVVLIDEAGIVIAVRPDDAAFERFLSRPPAIGESVRPDLTELDQADRAFLFEGDAAEAARRYAQTAASAPDNAPARFRLGVAQQARFEATGDPEAFGQAIDAWTDAIELRPNQYIWRRRVQQYGPRLDKPYPFYDWVVAARADIAERGDTPVPLRVEPRGAEIATPSRQFRAAKDTNPDPRARITNAGDAIRVRPVIVPHTGSPETIRLHLLFDLNGVHWNNEGDPMVVWIDPAPGWRFERQLVTIAPPPSPTSDEQRIAEFECQSDGAEAGPTLRGFALVGICTTADGACLYRRVPFSVEILRK